MNVFSLDHPDLPPLVMPNRFRMEVVYFMTPGGDPGVPVLGKDEYWIRLDEARRWLDELVVSIVSPLDAESVAEIELTDDHEAWLQWMVDHEVQHIRLARE